MLPVYNGERYLRAAIESIISQTFEGFELLIVCEPCTDGSVDIVESYGDPRIVYVQNEERLGLAASLNRGIALARGDFIARMDADDVSLPERLAKQVRFLEAHPEVGVLGTGAEIVDDLGHRSTTLRFPTEHGVLRWCLCFFNPILHPTVMMRRGVVEQLRGYDPAVGRGEDYDLWRRVSGVSRLANLADVLFHLRKHDANVSILNASEERRFSVEISRRMIAQVLKADVPEEVVQSLWDRDFEAGRELRPVAALLHGLYRVVVADGELTATGAREVRRDAARRLYALWRPWARSLRACGVLARACWLDPLLVPRVVVGRLWRAVAAGRGKPSFQAA